METTSQRQENGEYGKEWDGDSGLEGHTLFMIAIFGGKKEKVRFK